MNERITRWEKSGLLRHARNNEEKVMYGTLLNAQVEYNEAMEDKGPEAAPFKRMSVPIVFRILNALKDQINIKTEDVIQEEETALYSVEFNWRNYDKRVSLDEEADLCARIAKKLCEAVKTVSNFGNPGESVYFSGVCLDDEDKICIRYRLGE